jgi:hypothetical protein
VIDDLIELVLRRELSTRTLMTRLPARRSQHLLNLHPSLRPALLACCRWILRWRLGAVARALAGLLLELTYPLLKPRIPNSQPLKRPRQLKDELHAALFASLIDRLRLTELHTPKTRRSRKPSSLWKPTTERLRFFVGRRGVSIEHTLGIQC